MILWVLDIPLPLFPGQGGESVVGSEGRSHAHGGRSWLWTLGFTTLHVLWQEKKVERSIPNCGKLWILKRWWKHHWTCGVFCGYFTKYSKFSAQKPGFNQRISMSNGLIQQIYVQDKMIRRLRMTKHMVYHSSPWLQWTSVGPQIWWVPRFLPSVHLRSNAGGHSLEIAQLLIDARADVNKSSRPRGLHYLFHRACQSYMRYLTSNPPVSIKICAEITTTPLGKACFFGGL